MLPTKAALVALLLAQPSSTIRDHEEITVTIEDIGGVGDYEAPLRRCFRPYCGSYHYSEGRAQSPYQSPYQYRRLPYRQPAARTPSFSERWYQAPNQWGRGEREYGYNR